MASAPQSEHERLLQFLYQCPVGLASTDITGRISLLNATGSQVLMPIANGNLENLFDVLATLDPEIPKLVGEKPGVGGEICRDRRLRVPAGGRHGERWLNLTLLRLGNDSIEACFADVTAMVEAEVRLRESLLAQALQDGKIEIVTNVLHDIGNAVTGLGTRAARVMAESNWPELDRFRQLQQFLDQNRESLETALGPAKGAALIEFGQALFDALTKRQAGGRESATFFTNTVRHVQEILNLQRSVVSGGSGSKTSSLAVRDLIENALAIQHGGLEKRGIKTIVDTPAGLPALKADRTRILQVLINLIKNAAEAFDDCPPANDRKLQISTSVRDNVLEITFEDNASGFPPGDSETFFRRGESGKIQGSGFGLPHARSIIESHCGSLTLDSPGVGQGARATLRLPLDGSGSPQSTEQ